MGAAGDRLIVGLDLPSVAEAEKAVRDLDGLAGFYKIGYRLVFAGGLELARDLVAEGKRVFLDMKLLDIDNTVAEGVESVASTGVSMLTLHAYPKAMRAAVAAARAHTARENPRKAVKALKRAWAENPGTLYMVSVAGPKMYFASEDALEIMDRVGEDIQLYQSVQVEWDRLVYESRTTTGDLYDAFILWKDAGGRKRLEDRRPAVGERFCQRPDIPGYREDRCWEGTDFVRPSGSGEGGEG